MNALQATADAAEDSMIQRYRERSANTLEVDVSCGRCGVPQLAEPDRDVRCFFLVCYSCHERTLIVL
jgi:hypothetical protein